MADPEDSNLTAINEFKLGLVRSLMQYNAGETKKFDNVDDFLDYLDSAE